MKVSCETCGSQFNTYPSRVKIGWGKYCSKECNPNVFGNGRSTPWLGKKRPELKNTVSLKTMFKENQLPWNKGMIKRLEKDCIGCGITMHLTKSSFDRRKYCSKDCRSINSPSHKNGKPCPICFKLIQARSVTCKACWQNNKSNKNARNTVGYFSTHGWINNHFQKTGTCSHCKEDKKTEWANKTGLMLREESNWLELCRKCHVAFDRVEVSIYAKQKA